MIKCQKCGDEYNTKYAADLCCMELPPIEDAFNEINVEEGQNILTEEERNEIFQIALHTVDQKIKGSKNVG